MAARSIDAALINHTRFRLTLAAYSDQHGRYGATPPQTIESKATGNWHMESAGTGTGCEGQCTYIIETDGAPTVRLHYNNPFIGDNSQYSIVDQAGSHQFQIGIINDISGNNCNMVWKLQEVVEP